MSLRTNIRPRYAETKIGRARQVAFAAATLLVLAVGTPVSAFVQESSVSADVTDPRTQSASEFIALLSREDEGGAVNYLQSHAAPGFPAAANPKQQVLDLKTVLGPGFELGRIGLRGDVVAAVVIKPEGGRVGVRLAFEPTAPFRILSIQTVQPTVEHGNNRAQ